MNKQQIKATEKATSISRKNNAFVNKIRYVQGAIKHDIKTKQMSAVEKALNSLRLLDLDLAIASSFMKNKDSLRTNLKNIVKSSLVTDMKTSSS